ncbi:nuclear transport factor 2 family protein [Pedobacter sp.]|uniref:nuclear transport factor 2 family protein n=1 Tax=Pedobacter sp. TaxID=1411316 RepID=UPI003BAA6E07
MIKKLLIFASLILIANFSFAQDNEVEKAVANLTKLMINPDSSALDKLILGNLSYGHSNGKVETKQQFIHSLMSGNSDFLDINLAEQSIVIQNKTAIVRHVLSGKTNDRNVPGNIKLNIVLVWSKEKAGWKLLARQSVKVL